MSTPDTVQVLDVVGPELPIVAGEGTARAVVWPGAGARLRSMHLISLAPGASTREQLHAAEAVYYVIEGTGEVAEPGSAERQALEPGSMIHVDPGTAYVIAAGDGGLELVGGPSPPDEALYGG